MSDAVLLVVSSSSVSRPSTAVRVWKLARAEGHAAGITDEQSREVLP